MVMSHRIRMRTESFFYICMQQSNKKKVVKNCHEIIVQIVQNQFIVFV